MNKDDLEIDDDSKTWKSIEKWVRARIEQHLRTLETKGLELQVYDNARGSLEELRLLAKLSDNRNKK